MKTKILKTLFILSSFLVFFLFSLKSQAAFTENETLPQIPETLSLKLSPSVPLPNSTVRIAAIVNGGVGNDYIWFVNGIKDASSSGVNKSTYTLQAGPLGSAYKVSVYVTLSSGKTLQDAMFFTISDVDLTWAAFSLAPSDYKGKNLPSKGSAVTVSALPFLYNPGSKTQINPINLQYTWYLDGVVNQKNSGIGRQSYNFVHKGGTQTIKVEIKRPQNEATFKKFISVLAVNPQILPFLADENGKVMHNGVVRGVTVQKGKGINFKAVPYFFNSIPENLSWAWTVNGAAPKESPRIPWLASLNIPGNIATPATLEVKITAEDLNYAQEKIQSIIAVSIK